MFVKQLKDCKEFKAADASLLRELLHPAKTDLQIRYSLAHARVVPGEATKPHILRTSEVYYIIAGRGVMHINDESREVRPGCAVYIAPHSKQYIENTAGSDLEFLCIVDPAWREEDEQIFDRPSSL